MSCDTDMVKLLVFISDLFIIRKTPILSFNHVSPFFPPSVLPAVILSVCLARRPKAGLCVLV